VTLLDLHTLQDDYRWHLAYAVQAERFIWRGAFSYRRALVYAARAFRREHA